MTTIPRSPRDFTAAWLQGLKSYDSSTYLHSVRTAERFINVARFSGVCRLKAKHLYSSALMHDIGKLAVSLRILQKKGDLTPEEFQEVKKHPEAAFAWMGLARYSEELLQIPYFHHERWNGSGYPFGMQGHDIPRLVRLFSVVDVWDAMVHTRWYRDGIPEEVVLAHLRHESGKLFDPESVDVFLRWRRKSAVMPLIH